MFTAEACPDRRSYEQMLAGVFPPEAQLEQLAAHLEHCPRCAETVRELVRADTFDEGATKTLPPGGEEDAVARLMERLGRLTPSAAPGDAAPTECGAEADDDLGALLAPPQAEGEAGRLGPYRVLGVIGRGGMGVVLRALDPELGRAVALKVMRPGLTASAEARRRFAAEAQAMAAVEHDHITPVYHVGEERGVPFFLMPLLRGESLEARLGRTGKLPVAEATRIAREVAEGLAAAHARGLIHRDIKPANIWLEGEPAAPAPDGEPGALATGVDPPVANAPGSPRLTGGRVKLLDFGLARPVQADARLTQTGVLLGTPAYMAPEQARGEAVDGRCDLFSLGCVLYQMVTGELPFQGADAWSTLLAVTTQHPAPPRQLAPEVPPELDDLVLRLLAKDLPNRPASAQAVANELAALERQPAPAPAPARPAALPAGRSASRHRRWVAVAVAAVFLGVIGAGIAYQVIRVKDKDGNVIAEVKVPPGGGYEGEPLGPLALVPRPAKLDGVRSWTIETIRARGKLSNMTCAALSPDGSRLAIADGSSVHVYDAETGRLQEVLPTPYRDLSNALAWSPDGTRLAAACYYSWGAWEVRTGKLVCTVRSRLYDLAWSADGKTVAGCGRDGGGGVQFWDAATGEPLPLRLSIPNARYLAWSPDGRTLAAAGVTGKGVVMLWEFPSGKLVHTLPLAGGPFKPAWSPDSKTLVTACSNEKQDRLWDVATGKVVETYLDLNPAQGPAAISPDGKTLAACFGDGSNVVAFREIASGKPLRVTGPYQGGLTSLAWSPDGNTVMAQTIDKVILIEAATGKARRVLEPHPGIIDGLAWSSNGKRMATTSPLTIWDVQSGAVLRSLGSIAVPNIWGSLAFSPDGTMLAVLERSGIGIRDAETGQLLRECSEHASSVAWSPDGKSLASVGKGGKVGVWDAASGKPLRTLQEQVHGDGPVAWSPDGKLLALGDEQSVHLWDAASGQALRTLQGQGVFTLSWSPDNKSLAASGFVDMNTRVWDAESGRLRSSFPGRMLDWSADGRTVQTVNDFLVQRWDVHSVLRLHSFPAPTTPALPLGASPDHRIGATICEGPARLWELDSGRPCATLLTLGDGAWLAVSPEGHYRGSPGVEKELVYVVQTDKGQDVLTPEEFARRHGWKNDPNRVSLLPR